jgi:mitogen-activated protein kinase kinase kinase 1
VLLNFQEIYLQVLLALVQFHKKDRIHKAVRPENIVIDKRGDVKLGIYTLGEERDRDQKHFYYLPPELITNNISSTKMDVWALGCTTIEIITGKMPKRRYPPLKVKQKIYVTLTRLQALFRTATSEPPSLRKTKDYWSYTVRDFISKCLQPDPEKRPTAEELLDDPFIKMASRDTVGSRIAAVFINDAFEPGTRRNLQTQNSQILGLAGF